VYISSGFVVAVQVHNNTADALQVLTGIVCTRSSREKVREEEDDDRI